MIFRFTDRSLFDERVTFSRQHVFTLLSYRLVQQGPSLPEPMDVSLDRTQGRYQVKSLQKGREETSSGELDLPADVCNDMTVVILKNLARGRSESVQQGEAARYSIKPKLGVVMDFVAALLGKTPADYECVLWTKDIPTFVRCDGPQRLKGAVYRIELPNPQ